MKTQNKESQLDPNIFAETGRGKSFLLRKMAGDRLLKEKEIGPNSEPRIIDNRGEYTGIAKSLTGKTIHLQ